MYQLWQLARWAPIAPRSTCFNPFYDLFNCYLMNWYAAFSCFPGRLIKFILLAAQNDFAFMEGVDMTSLIIQNDVTERWQTTGSTWIWIRYRSGIQNIMLKVTWAWNKICFNRKSVSWSRNGDFLLEFSQSKILRKFGKNRQEVLSPHHSLNGLEKRLFPYQSTLLADQEMRVF